MGWVANCFLVLVGVLVVCWRSEERSGSHASTTVTDVFMSQWSSEPVASSPSLEAYSRAALARRTLQLILNHTSTRTTTFAFVSPCLATTGNVTESTSSLLVATALTKADNTTLQSHNLWRYFNSLFSVPSSGFIPRYSYPVDGRATNDFYVGSTRIPNWSLFQNNTQPSPCTGNETSCWVGSGRISAIPFHGTVLLELLLTLQRRRLPVDGNTQTISQHELHQLSQYWNQIYEYHEYLHGVVMRGCLNQTNVPCYNILHPWESLLAAPSSPSWQIALRPVLERIALSNWTPAFEVPPQVQSSYDYNATIYNAMLYLNECLMTQISTMDQHQYPYDYQGDATLHENRLLEACQFAMLDVGYASALAQADRDLRTVGIWLSAQGGMTTVSSSWTTRMDRLDTWQRQNDYVMNLLWHADDRSFQSRYSIPTLNATEFPFPTMRFLRTPSANNLMVFWQDWNGHVGLQSTPRHRDTMQMDMDQPLQEMAMQLLRHSGENSFDCGGSYPLWSAGCTTSNNIASSNFIDPRWNYFVGLGLSRNKDLFAPFAHYITNATIQLICNSGATDEDPHIQSSCAWNLSQFQEAYTVSSNTNSSFYLDECGSTSVSTASILYHLLVDDFDFTSESPIPPIRNSWVIILITAELMIAFAVGVTCVVLSLHIVRRENHEDMDQMLQDDSAGYDPLMQNVEEFNQTSAAGDDIMRFP